MAETAWMGAWGTARGAATRAASNTAALERRLQREAEETAGEARCPACRAPLVVRVTCRGPRFVCLCAEKGFQ